MNEIRPSTQLDYSNSIFSSPFDSTQYEEHTTTASTLKNIEVSVSSPNCGKNSTKSKRQFESLTPEDSSVEKSRRVFFSSASKKEDEPILPPLQTYPTLEEYMKHFKELKVGDEIVYFEAKDYVLKKVKLTSQITLRLHTNQWRCQIEGVSNEIAVQLQRNVKFIGTKAVAPYCLRGSLGLSKNHVCDMNMRWRNEVGNQNVSPKTREEHMSTRGHQIRILRGKKVFFLDAGSEVNTGVVMQSAGSRVTLVTKQGRNAYPPLEKIGTEEFRPLCLDPNLATARLQQQSQRLNQTWDTFLKARAEENSRAQQ